MSGRQPFPPPKNPTWASRAEPQRNIAFRFGRQLTKSGPSAENDDLFTDSINCDRERSPGQKRAVNTYTLYPPLTPTNPCFISDPFTPPAPSSRQKANDFHNNCSKSSRRTSARCAFYLTPKQAWPPPSLVVVFCSNAGWPCPAAPSAISLREPTPNTSALEDGKARPCGTPRAHIHTHTPAGENPETTGKGRLYTARGQNLDKSSLARPLARPTPPLPS